jgi:hypothetical protein
MGMPLLYPKKAKYEVEKPPEVAAEDLGYQL